MGQSSRTASSQSIAENSDDNGLQRRPEFEEACLGAVEDFRRGQIDRIAATTRIAIAISNECILSVDEEQASYQKYFMILAQRAQRLEWLDRGLTMLRQKLMLATRVRKSSKSQPKSKHPKKRLSSLLDRLSIPEPKERAEQSSQRREIQKRSCPVFAQTTHPALIARLTSP
jgi:hypothetical protein